MEGILANANTTEIGATAFIELDHKIFTPLHDSHGNIIAIKGSKSLETYSYDAFGAHDLSRNPWRYQSKRTDSTGLINFGRRYYIPELGRWLTPDPAGFTDADNLYQYALNNPFSHHDPYGESLGGYLFGVGEMALGLALVAGFTVAEIGTCGGFTFGIGIATTGIGLMAHGASIAAANSHDLSMPSRSHTTHRSYDGRDPHADTYLRKKADKNTNPFDGPVDEDIMIVDEDGNIIPIKEGNKDMTILMSKEI